LAAFAAALAACPLEPGQPDAILDATFGGDAARWYGEPAPEAARAGADAIAEVAATLLRSIAGGIGATNAGGRPLSARLLGDLAPILSLVVTAARGHEPPVAVDDLDVAAVLRLSLRQQLFGARATIGQHAAAGIVRLALIQLCAVYGARVDAAADGRDSV